MATKTAKRPSARERLLSAADELFYRDGVHSTGIDAVIEKAGVAKGSLYYIFGGKDELVAAYLRGRHEVFRQSVEQSQAYIDDPAGKILALFDVLADYVSRPEFRGCPFDSAAAEAPAGECQVLAIKEYRDWLHESVTQLATDTAVSEPQALAEALIVLFNGALATANTAAPSRAPAVTAKRLAGLTLAAAKASSSV
jgi:AcrR family transcriptional regulator